jgi:flavin-binding protein dodecin
MMRKVIALFDEYQSKENAKHVIRLRDLRVAEVVELDMALDNGKVTYRAKVNVSFKYGGG